MQSAVGGIYECGTVDLPQNQQGAHLMSLGCKTRSGHLRHALLPLLGCEWPPGGAEGVLPCCRPGAGQCSCSRPTVSGQPWPGEGGWLRDTKLFHVLRTPPPRRYNLTVTPGDRGTALELTYGATVSLISSHHQGRTSTFVHRVDLCPVAKHQLKARHVFGKRSSVQWGPTGTARDTPVSRNVAASSLTDRWTEKATLPTPV